MASVLFSWELGSGLGHLNRMLQVARALQQQGHWVSIAARDLRQIQQVVRQHDRIRWFQAPVWLSAIGGHMPSATYAELLFAAGFGKLSELLGLVRGWHSLFAALQPDLLIADHAPVSLLSAHGLPFKKVTIGTGFYYPPPVSPCPVFRNWAMVAESRVLQAEQQALANANQVLAVLGRPKLQHLHELFATDACFLTVWPELDHYYPRQGQRHTYTGPLIEQTDGINPKWPPVHGRKIFAYLKASYPALPQALQILANSNVCVLAYVAGLGREQMPQYASPSLAFALQPVQFAAALQTADLIVCHGGMGTVSAALQAGTPVLALPMHAEQRITGERLAALGCGNYLTAEEVSPKLADNLCEWSSVQLDRARLDAFRHSRPAITNSAIIERIVNHCETLLCQELSVHT